MSIFSGLWAGAKMIMGFGGGESSGTDNVMKVASGIGSYIDEQEFTPEEKAVHNTTMIGHMGSFMESTVAENTERSKTRRDIALLVIRWELLMLTASILLYKIDKGYADYIYKICTQDPISYLVLGIGAFFFGSHIVRAMKG